MANRRPLIVNASAGQIQELTDSDDLSLPNSSITAESFVGGGTIPVGGIIMWSGTIAQIASISGWELCDGTNGTPDLRNRFIVGAHSGTNPGTTAQAGPGFNVTTGALADNYEPGDFGGETAHQLTEAELASHSHTVEDVQGPNDNLAEGGSPVPAGGSSSEKTSSDTGDDNYHENRPPYYALAFIMRTT